MSHGMYLTYQQQCVTTCGQPGKLTKPDVQGFYEESRVTDSRPQLRANTGFTINLTIRTNITGHTGDTSHGPRPQACKNTLIR